MGPTLSTETPNENKSSSISLKEKHHKKSKKETIFILDWDDTLMCTSFISLKNQNLSREEKNTLLQLGKIVSSFLSQKFNRRTDEYGGSDENRAKFLIEIIKKIREAIGDEMIISAKIDSVNEEMGFTEKGFLTTGKLLEEAGVDLLEVTGVNALQKGDMYFYNDTKKTCRNR